MRGEDVEEVKMKTLQRLMGRFGRLGGGSSRVVWAVKRWRHGVPDGERLFGGFTTKCPEICVEPHHQRRSPGTPVWVDGRQLDRRFYLTVEGEIVSRDERLAGLAESNPHIEVDLLNMWVQTGASIYDRDRSFGDRELALNILYELVGEDAGSCMYEDFADEVIGRLPRAELPPGDYAEDPNYYIGRYAEWYLSEGEIRTWIRARS